MHKAEKERQRLERKENMDKFRTLLQSMDEIDVNTKWRSLCEKLNENEVGFSPPPPPYLKAGLQIYLSLDKVDRTEVFDEYIRELMKKEKERLEIEKEKVQKNIRKLRITLISDMSQIASLPDSGRCVGSKRSSEDFSER